MISRRTFLGFVSAVPVVGGLIRILDPIVERWWFVRSSGDPFRFDFLVHQSGKIRAFFQGKPMVELHEDNPGHFWDKPPDAISFASSSEPFGAVTSVRLVDGILNMDFVMVAEGKVEPAHGTGK